MARKDSKPPTDRLPPNSESAEAGVLGCILLNPTESLMRCISQLPGPEVFFSLAHRKVYELLLVMHDGREPIDMITVIQRLTDAGQVEAVGGRPYLASLPDSVPNAGHLDRYLQIVFEKYKRRRMIQGCTEVIGQCYDESVTADGEESPEQAIERMQRELVRVATMGNRKPDWSVKGAVQQVIKDIETDIASNGALTGLSTGFRDIDSCTRGLQPEELIVIAARPGLGKTSIACNIADHIAVDCRLPVGFVSLEMPKAALVRRMMSSRSTLNLRHIARDDLYAQEDISKLTLAGGKLAGGTLHIEDSPGMSEVEVCCGVLRQMYHEHGIKIGMVDYLQRMKSRRRFDSRAQEVAHISDAMKSLARELRIPMLVLAQLNRDVVKRKGERPTIADLKESGAIEQDADIVGLIYSTDPEDEEDSPEIPVALRIGKNRNGPKPTIRLLFKADIFRFVTPSKIQDKDVPRETPSDPRFKD